MNMRFATAAAAALSALLSSGHANADLVVLQYHHISDTTPAATSTSVALFKAQLQRIEALGLTVVPLHEGTQRALAGNGEHAVALSFDDAYSSVWSAAAPELAKLNYPYTIFVNTETVGQQGFMTLPQLQELEARGLATIANHSAGHGHLAKTPNESKATWQARIEHSLDSAQQALERDFEHPLPLFAYPYGEFDQALEQTIKQRGWLGFGQHSGPVGASSDSSRLPRFPMANAYGQLDALNTKLRSKALPVSTAALPDGIVRDNPPTLQMTLPEALNPQQLTCFGSGQGAIEIDAKGQDVTVRAPAPFNARRFRYNCTHPAGAGRFYWLSQPWLDMTQAED